MTKIPPGTKCEECENDDIATEIWSPGGDAIPVCGNCWDIMCSSSTYIEVDGTEVVDYSHGQNSEIVSITHALREIEGLHRPYEIVEIKTDRRKSIPHTWTVIPGDFQNEREAESALDSVAFERSIKRENLGVRHKAAIQPTDTSFWKARDLRIKEIAKSNHPEYLIERFSRDGSFRSTGIVQVEGDWHRIEVNIYQSRTVTNLGAYESLAEALLMQTDAVTIGPEMTFIHTNDDVHRLISLFQGAKSDSDFSALDGWETFAFYRQWDWSDVDDLDEDFKAAMAESWNYSQTISSINGNQLLKVIGPDIDTFILLDKDLENLRPLVTDVFLTDWWMSSGPGPVTWDGNTVIGLSGPEVLVTVVTGDVDSGFTLQKRGAPEGITELLVQYIINTWHVAEPFLLNAIGLTDWPDGTYFDYRHSMSDDTETHHEVLVHLADDEKNEIIHQVENSSERLKEVANALRDSRTKMGAKIYALLPGLKEGEFSTYDLIDILRGNDPEAFTEE